MNSLGMLLSGLMIAAAAVLPPSAAALNSHLSLQDYNHAVWTAKDGAPEGISSMAQTMDGWLWLGTSYGLYRFDGKSFYRYVPPTGFELLGERIAMLRALDDGNLLIAYEYGGVTLHRPDGSLQHLVPGHMQSQLGNTNQIEAEPDGSVWLATRTGLHHYVGGQLHRYGDERGFPDGVAAGVTRDDAGRIWASTGFGTYLLDRGADHFSAVGATAPPSNVIFYDNPVQAPDGRFWRGHNGRLAILDPAAPTPAPRSLNRNASESRGASIFDRHGNLWFSATPGLGMIADADKLPVSVLDINTMASSKLDQPWQMSSLVVRQLLEDHDGTVWIATESGLERFRENRLLPLPGVPATEGYSVANDEDGRIWLSSLNAPVARYFTPAGGAPVATSGGPYTVVERAHDGALLLASTRYIERRYRGAVQRYLLPPGRNGRPVDRFVGRVIDDGARLWVGLSELGSIALVDGVWIPSQQLGLELMPSLSVVAGKGQLWNGYSNGNVIFYDNGKNRRYAANLGAISGLQAGPDMLVAGEKGLAVLHGDHFEHLSADDPDVLQQITGMAVTTNGDQWLNGRKGIVHVRRDDWRSAITHRGTPLRYELIDAIDGYIGLPTKLVGLNSIRPGPSGSLLFMQESKIIQLAPSQFDAPRVAPPVRILGLRHDGKLLAPVADLRLPPGSDSFGIDYTALNLSRPEKLRFQYQLEGVDHGWQDAATRRAAYYTNVGAGTYRFRVRASNGDEAWGDAETTFTVEPTLTQTTWFRLLLVLGILGLLYLLYLYRLRRMMRRLEERMQVRVEERERIARTLHDTILQSAQSVVLQVHAIAISLPVGSPVRTNIEQVVTHANDLVIEGRDEVAELRRADPLELRAALDLLSQEMWEGHAGTKLTSNEVGTARLLLKTVQQEVVAIAREAMHNARQHANAEQILLQLNYGHKQFELRIADNGVGMADGDADKQGHWGLTGMRERAARIGGTLLIDSSPGAGTTVTLTVRAKAAYLPSANVWPW